MDIFLQIVCNSAQEDYRKPPGRNQHTESIKEMRRGRRPRFCKTSWASRDERSNKVSKGSTACKDQQRWLLINQWLKNSGELFWWRVFILTQRQLDSTSTMQYTSTVHPEAVMFDQPPQDLHILGCEPHPWMSRCHRWEGKAAPTILQKGVTPAMLQDSSLRSR